MFHYNADHPLRRYFSGLAEHAFLGELGVADPPLIDYLSELLSRFISMDAIHRFQAAGRSFEQVAELLLEAEAFPPEGRTYREVHRHIGDFTLFWTGVYPEALRRLKSPSRIDHFVDYCRQGKRSYSLAASIQEDPDGKESRVLQRLSEQYEMCAYGLSQVRKEWEQSRRPG